MRFSVCTATRDRPGWLSGCLQAVQTQTFQDWEHVVYDVGERPIKNMLPDDPRVRYVRGTSDGLAPDARAALSLAQGEVVTVLHDDDRMPENALEIVNSMIGDKDWLVGRTVFVNPAGVTFMERGGHWKAFEDTVTGTMMLGAGVYWRRDFYNQVGGIDPVFDAAWDFELYIRMAKHSEPVVIPDVLHIYNDHPLTETNLRRGEQLASMDRIRRERVA